MGSARPLAKDHNQSPSASYPNPELPEGEGLMHRPGLASAGLGSILAHQLSPRYCTTLFAVFFFFQYLLTSQRTQSGKLPTGATQASSVSSHICCSLPPPKATIPRTSPDEAMTFHVVYHHVRTHTLTHPHGLSAGQGCVTISFDSSTSRPEPGPALFRDIY